MPLGLHRASILANMATSVMSPLGKYFAGLYRTSYLFNPVVQWHLCGGCSPMGIDESPKDLHALCPLPQDYLQASSASVGSPSFHLSLSGSWLSCKPTHHFPGIYLAAHQVDGQVYASVLCPLRECPLTTVSQPPLNVAIMQQQSILNQPIFDSGQDTFFLHQSAIVNSLKP